MFDANTDDANPNESHDEPTRRTVLLGATTAVTAAIAGCSGGNDGEGSDGGTSSPSDGGSDATPTATEGDGGATPTSTPSGPTKEEMGEVGENRITRIEIVGWRSEAGGDIFQVYPTFQNTGDETIESEAYTWGLRIYDDSGSEMQSGASISVMANDDGTVPPGETGEMFLEMRPDDATKVAKYDIYLSCQGRSADGVYCPE